MGRFYSAAYGFLWYLGESNGDRGYEYRTLFPAMISNWRKEWGQGDLPFLFVQLAPYFEKRRIPGQAIGRSFVKPSC